MRKRIYPAETSTQSFGQLSVNTVTQLGFKPINSAKVTIRKTTPGNEIVEELTTTNLGRTVTIDLDAPPLEYSLEPNNPKPYSEYNLEITAPEFESVNIEGCQILPNELALQDVRMIPTVEVSSKIKKQQQETLVIDPHTLYAEYPPKIPESEVKDDVEDSFIVLNQPVVPSIIIVHDGSPDDTSAPNYFVPFTSYIKNVASSEIYSTWPESTIQANILAILSFTLNRIYTEWYRAKGKNFNITSSTAFDHKFVYGRNVYRNISDIVDQLFVNYLSRPGIVQPILTQYCDGIRVQCENWMTQWGSKYRGDLGEDAIEILRYFYGMDMYINTAEKVSGIPSSFPGYNLQQGSTGEPVRVIQRQLNAISKNYPAIPILKVDGVFGPKTKEAVETFQKAFLLPVTGIVDYPTWYKISDIFVAVTRLAELV
ncbi:peptidoglycan-binding protein [Vallitalea sp.]|jgi:peptidoglycan hydrolase-like protein with peptidoglycan-binding domain|uniref:peptidoglycan-binding protein n=1 Tax=Vallitalea sp. TaxID=1882829 RepID=UPI0025D37DAE|nr:peptidoglycan-binding protein [Vallitalea sp.]MCT4686493.1 peptidoglycan-binding protein [Vallitalea sp.]